MENKKVSIIMPTYNADKSLEKALNSVLNQKYTNWELIVIENGKKGRAEEICNSYQNEKIKYKFVEEANVSNARNVGIDESCGDYIAFLDSDDEYEVNFLEKMIDKIEKDESQLVTCGFKKIFSKEEMLLKNSENVNLTANIKEYLEILKENYLYNEIWNKLYIAEIIKKFNIKMPKEMDLGEDFIFNIDYAKHINKASYINEMLYRYTDGDTGLKLKYRKDKFDIECKLTKYLEEFYKENNWNMDYIYNRYARVYYNLIIDIYKENNPASKKEKDDRLKEIISSKQFKEELNLLKDKVTDIKFKIAIKHFFLKGEKRTKLFIKLNQIRKKEKKQKVYIDAYFAENLGDDIFIDILTKRYQNCQFYAITENRKNYNRDNLKVYTNKYMYKILKKFSWEKYLAGKFKTVVTIGGSMFMERNDSNKDFSMGKKNNRYILGINFGPYKTEKYYQNIHNMLSKVKDVCFREKYSYDLFKDLPNVRCASDIVFSMNTSDINITKRKRVIISIISPEYKLNAEYKEQYENAMLQLIQMFMKKEYEVMLMSFCKMEHDEEEIQNILNKMDEEQRKKVETYYYNGNIEGAMNVLADSQVIVGGRFHANILGLLLSKSIIPVLYSDKTLNVLKDMNIDAPVIDIRNLKDFDISSITDADLSKVYNVEKEKIDAQRHFEKLDIELGRS